MRYFFLLLLPLIISCTSATPDAITIKGEAFGTSYAVKYFGQGDNAKFIQKGIDSVVYAVNKSMSTYIPDSDISRINRGDTTVVIDEMFKDVFTLSRKLNKATSGYFDPTVGVLRNAYGFGDTKPLEYLDENSLDSLMQMVGWDKVKITAKGTIAKENLGIYFDFNAIAKGYGIDRIGVFLEQQNLNDYLIELGGELKAKGKNLSKNTSWNVGIEAVNSSVLDRKAVASVSLDNASMAGSGNYRKYRIDERTGKKYVHTINPLTGAAEELDILSANVIAPTCAEADAWATAFMAMGIEKSKKLLASHPELDAYLTWDGGAYATKGFKDLMTP